MKLAAEKSLNRGICPVMNIKGKTVTYPFTLQYNYFSFACAQGILGAKQMMVMDIIGTHLIHRLHKNFSFSGRIPQPKEKRVKEISGQYMSAKLLKYMAEHLSPANKGIIPEGWYSEEGNLYDVDKVHARIKKPFTITLNDGQLRRELPFLKKYSSRQIGMMIVQTSQCTILMNYPICIYTGKKYEAIPFNNFGHLSRLFTLEKPRNSKVSKSGKVLEREYRIRFDTVLGYMFAQNISSSYMDLLPGKFYEMSDYAQLYYRLFILSYYPNKATGKIPKNPLSIEEIRKRLALKTKDTSMVRKVIRRILEELKANNFIGGFTEEKLDRKYVYRYVKNSWQEITGEESPSETDLGFDGN